MHDSPGLEEEGLYREDDHYIGYLASDSYIYMDPDYASGLLSPRTLETFA